MITFLQTSLGNALCAAHVMLFTMVPEQTDIEDDPYVAKRRRNMTAWFPVLAVLVGFFACGLIIAVISIICITALVVFR